MHRIQIYVTEYRYMLQNTDNVTEYRYMCTEYRYMCTEYRYMLQNTDICAQNTDICAQNTDICAQNTDRLYSILIPPQPLFCTQNPSVKSKTV